MTTSRRITLGTNAEATRVAVLADKADGLPAPGVHDGDGRHVSIPQVFTPGAIGWSSNHGAVNGADFEAATDDHWLAAQALKASTLSAAERTELAGLIAPVRRFSSRFDPRFW